MGLTSEEWHSVKSQLTIMFEERFPMAQLKVPGHKITHTPAK